MGFFREGYGVAGAIGGKRVSPILDAVRAFRRVLLPRAQAAVEGIVARAEALGLKSPSAGKDQSIKSWGARAKPRPRITKSRNSHLDRMVELLAEKYRAS
jgi:hypothetical protein